MMERSIEPWVGPDITEPRDYTTQLERRRARAVGRPRILVADDDASTSEFLASFGEGATCDLVSVRDGREAFRLLRRDAAFNAAIFNVAMPHLKGVDILHYMKTEKRLSRIPVIILGGGSGLACIADSFAAGALAFLPKPFGKDQLHRILRLILKAHPVSDAIPRAA